jgi:hypothetical protein
LDIGCGAGRLGEQLKKKAEDSGSVREWFALKIVMDLLLEQAVSSRRAPRSKHLQTAQISD